MAVLPPGIGNPQQALQATAFLREQPWYQQLVSSWGMNPTGDANGNVHLNDAQQQQLLSAAQQHGIGISDSYEIDPNGQIAQKPSHLLRNIGIGAGIAGLALTGFGAAGIGPLAGALGGAGAAGAGAAGASAAGAGAAGAATGAGVGTAAATGAGWFSPALIGSGLSAVSQIYGANKASDANSQAAQLQYQSTEEALADARAQRAYQQEQYQNYLQRLAPYNAIGTQAGSTLGQLIARSPYSQYAQTGQAPAPQQYTLPSESIGALMSK